MTILSQLTPRGKEIYRLSLSDLGDAVTSGARLRACCPIHGSDHQRSLSIDRATGWGFCHCCHATVLVEAISSVLAARQSDDGEQHDAQSQAGAMRTSAEQRILAPSAGPHLAPQAHPVTRLPDWQREEVAALRAALPLAREALAGSRRVQRYLAQRGLPVSVALASGMGYLSRAVWEQLSGPAERHLLKRWVGRLVFPLHSPCGEGFIGRTLLLWEPGMDENTHKMLLERPGAPRRWIKTNPAGWFGSEALSRAGGSLILVEGGFDRLALLSAGMPAESVLALVGTAARPLWLRQLAPPVTRVVLALDADDGGQEAMARLAKEFRLAGYTVSFCPPPRDRWGKDWSERWRRLGPQSVWPLYEALALADRSGAGKEARP